MNKQKARQLAHEALNRGEIILKPCEKCGTLSNLEMHHPDYDKPAEIVWLCSQCHKAEHGKHINKVGRCPNCASTQFYFRKRTQDWQCRTCSRAFDAPAPPPKLSRSNQGQNPQVVPERQS